MPMVNLYFFSDCLASCGIKNASVMAIHSNIYQIHTSETCEVSCKGLQEVFGGSRFSHC